MKIEIVDTFWDGLKKISFKSIWYMKLIDLFRYDIPHYLKNLKRFNKILWNYRGWNGDQSLLFMEESIRHTCFIIENYGMEFDESRLKKIAKMKRTCDILNNINENRYIEIAEKSLGREIDTNITFGEPDENGTVRLNLYKNEEEEKFSSEVFKLTRELEDAEWKELWVILQGQDFPKGMSREEYDKFYDGSGLKGWWD